MSDMLKACSAAEQILKLYRGDRSNHNALRNAILAVRDIHNGDVTARARLVLAWPRVKQLATLQVPKGPFVKLPPDFNRDEWAATAVESLVRVALSDLNGITALGMVTSARNCALARDGVDVHAGQW